MQNFLIIEIFNNKLKCVIKTKEGSSQCDICVINSIKRILPKINSRYLIKIYGTFDINGAVFGCNNGLTIDILDCKYKVSKKHRATSMDEMIDIITNINSECVKRKALIIKNYNQIIFDKDVFMIILALTQQYFMLNVLELKNRMKLDVITPNGIEALIKEGKSVCIMEPIMGLSSYENLEIMNVDSEKTLWAINLNNCISSLNLTTGNYYFSFEVKNSNGEVDIVRLERSCKEFWSNIKVCEFQDDVYFGLGF